MRNKVEKSIYKCPSAAYIDIPNRLNVQYPGLLQFDQQSETDPSLFDLCPLTTLSTIQ